MILFRPIRVLAAFLPFLLSLLRDRRKWVLFGIPRVLSEEQRKARLLEAIATMADDLKETVNEIETNVEHKHKSQHCYQSYWRVIQELADSKNMGMIVALALIKAGANKQGVMHAMRLQYS